MKTPIVTTSFSSAAIALGGAEYVRQSHSSRARVAFVKMPGIEDEIKIPTHKLPWLPSRTAFNVADAVNAFLA